MNTKKYIFSIIVLVAIGGFALSTPIFADNNQQKENSQNDQEKINKVPVIVGTVSIINGNTITLIGKQNSEDTTATVTFTIDATNAVITKNGAVIAVSGIAIGDTLVVKGTITGTNVVAITIRDGKSNQGDNDSERMSPVVVGKVSAINGNILTVIGKQGFNKTENTSTTTFTVDATNAKLLRGNTTITLSNISINDNVVVQGTLTGTNVVATTIRDGKVGNGKENDNNQALLQIQGDGQPVVAGTVSAINGSILTVANANVTYAVDATNAKIVQGKNTILISGVKTGDLVIVQGAVNGTSIIASTIIDQTNPTGKTINPKKSYGFFGSIGQFFRRLFGF